MDAENRNNVAKSPVELIVGPRYRDLVGFKINRVWPTPKRRLIGPFIFLDHLMPAILEPGQGLDVPPHPHIGLATVTYLFDGELVHRDSLGIEQVIRPRDLNWMQAGRGIVHSERSSRAARAGLSRLHGLQAWVALPRAAESLEPSFAHYPQSDIPTVRQDGADFAVVAGTAFGATSPVATSSELFFVDAKMRPGAQLAIDERLGERAAYVASGRIALDSTSYSSGRLLVFESGAAVTITAMTQARLLLFGGAPLGEDRYVWWNFVASTPEAIESAKSDWRAQKFPAVPGDREFMPMPD